MGHLKFSDPQFSNGGTNAVRKSPPEAMPDKDLQPPNAPSTPFPAMRYVWGGWLCLVASSTIFYLCVHGFAAESDTGSALLMMTARIFGLGAFIAGSIAIFHRWWVHGTLLFAGSVALPMISLLFYGYL